MVNKLLESLGYTKEEIDKIHTWFNQSKDDTLYNYIINTYDYFESKNYDKKDIKKMFLKFPALVAFNNEIYKQKEELFLNDGFDENQIRKLTRELPAIYSYSKERFEEKKQLLLKYGFSQSDYIFICNSLPSIYGYSLENLENKLNFYNKYDLMFIIKEKPKSLMQSAELTHSRYLFLIETGLIINRETYAKLFYSDNNFMKKFNISNKELQDKYKFSDIQDKETREK